MPFRIEIDQNVFSSVLLSVLVCYQKMKMWYYLIQLVPPLRSGRASGRVEIDRVLVL